jgi:hypothetical protein
LAFFKFFELPQFSTINIVVKVKHYRLGQDLSFGCHEHVGNFLIVLFDSFIEPGKVDWVWINLMVLFPFKKVTFVGACKFSGFGDQLPEALLVPLCSLLGFVKLLKEFIFIL